MSADRTVNLKATWRESFAGCWTLMSWSVVHNSADGDYAIYSPDESCECHVESLEAGFKYVEKQLGAEVVETDTVTKKMTLVELCEKFGNEHQVKMAKIYTS